ncbi:putative secreted protein (Por secretion system target) [Tenacibaculum skagerrakense]|uniref:Putative secreted protein (Por secretion system target) n=1 Tax=Tenacibaculum skagerrakense TaxID=186571 RepID=A0A4R2NKI2_9FLAO|nr:T9SS type A sorting domain-containing protein [Tenacibaculum skagerrakense]TCP22109.1 putative secreted protein (Por secretion system target) [Tenacibaculum skagerrakense]
MKQLYFKHVTKLLFCFTFLFSFQLVLAQTPSPTTMEFGSSVVVLANSTNPSANASTSSELNNFDVSGVSSNSRLIAFANAGNGGGTNAIGSSTDHVLIWTGDSLGTFSSGTMSSTDGTEFSISAMEFAYELSFGASIINFTIEGKKDGATVGTVALNSPPHNTEINIDFTLPTSGSFTNIDEIVIIPATPINGGFSVDEVVIGTAVSCTDPDVPTVTATNASICNGSSTDLNITGSLNDATQWHVYTGSCGGTQIGTTSTGTFNVSPTITTTYFIRGEGGCVTPGSCGTVTVTVNNLDDASFSYSAAAYCVNDADPTPTITGLGGGTFSSTAGISINASTGQIDVSASTPGTYTVTYTTAGTCPNASNVSVTINGVDDASFSYGASSYCVNAADPSPTITGLTGGSFSSTAGLSINSSTGQIDVSASTPNTYTVTYTTAGTCPNASNVSVTINALDDASFSYGAASYCVNAADPSPTITGLTGGTFSSTAGLSINSSTGQIDVSASTPNTYTVTYTTAGTCPNASNVSVTINALDDASFSYGAASYCVNAADPSPTITGLTGGSFSSTAGLSINSSTGQIDVSASTPGTYTVTYTTAGTCPNASNESVTINTLDDASFSYGASSYTIDDADPTPTITGLGGGTFSSTAGLSINASTGTIDVSASTPATYTVTYTTAGTCPNSSNVSVTITFNNYTWTGAINNSWEQPSNWNTNVAPHSTGNAIIPSGVTNYPTITSPVTVSTISIASGASVIANASVTGDVTYTRNLPTTNWYLVAAPVSGETLEDVIAGHTFASGTGSNLGIGIYTNNGASPWIYATAASTGSLASGAGVSVKLATAGNVSITGTINSSNVNTPITTGTRTNFNLIGNPFTAYANSASFAASNTALLTEETVWLWDGSQYVTYNAVSPIELAPGQGFFVEAASSGNVTFATSNQSHQSDTFMRQEPKTSFELFVENDDDKKGTKVFYVNNKTTGFDNGYDSKMFEGVSVDFGVFTQLVADDNGNKLAIQTLPNTDHETMIIPVGLIAGANKEITFSVSETNLPSGIQIYLEDRANNTFVNLSEGNHTITTKSAVNGIGQYYIHASSARLSNDDITQNIANVSIYKSAEQEITVAGLQANATVKIISLLGEELASTDINSNGLSKVLLPNLPTGVYVVKLNSALGNITKKIIVE